MDPDRPRLREARVRAGLTQTELAGLTGARQPHIARWESGKQLPRVDTALRLAAALKTTVDAIWSSDPEKRPRRPRKRSRGQATSEVPDAARTG
jgi:transcriptional regulator with XRE-family HTH domain